MFHESLKKPFNWNLMLRYTVKLTAQWKLPPMKIASYENTHLSKFPPLKVPPSENRPLKIAPKKITPRKLTPRKLSPMKVATIVVRN